MFALIDGEVCFTKKRNNKSYVSVRRIEKDAEVSSSKSVKKVTPKKEKAVVVAGQFDAEVAKAAFGKKVKENDLTIVEGIGPKIAELFNDNGIATWEQLSNATVEECKAILEKGGSNYSMHNPTTWAKQLGRNKQV